MPILFGGKLRDDDDVCGQIARVAVQRPPLSAAREQGIIERGDTFGGTRARALDAARCLGAAISCAAPQACWRRRINQARNLRGSRRLSSSALASLVQLMHCYARSHRARQSPMYWNGQAMSLGGAKSTLSRAPNWRERAQLLAGLEVPESRSTAHWLGAGQTPLRQNKQQQATSSYLQRNCTNNKNKSNNNKNRNHQARQTQTRTLST